ncbi:MAG: hypothetical protein A2X67_07470 [Ignavibacteria bacterium GWA2_55_11]|nr:MAG: hypothetical protein A2X67_07470 [Ignavibacteria bacterium GWA2_55_11]OGU43631.1 MAG: hypothetical protein A2X68_06355 [Ignavibacteria bacterium GWC2_56_12]OGU66239.1 MAG: hypothetical protein A3C56_08225 [Ignavibacteria bacterium RIFCSPHIGHO2_02_FULL_56_12]OGU69911.1 MAG: hypothetical protein A3H45_07455 [Ignavibacteria bacterium RIFCSPLOWO2_02_FULL_55_14]OGU76399.1 MAG: hypothetical protein A3G43_00125 [Ignavibacteria bacterium RIFCSPLOWO2_12_FULL_56_21]HAV22977.1 hypothetical protei
MTQPHDIRIPVSSDKQSRGTKRVLIFSPDADLARTLVLILEERFQITRETSVSALETTLGRERPDLVLVDLFTFSEDVRRVLELLRLKAADVPLVILRGYRPLQKDVNADIETMGSIVFYKPVDVDLVSQAIENILHQ